MGRMRIWIVTIPQFSRFSGDKMFTTDPAVESFRTSSRRLVIIEGILAILIALSRPLRVSQRKIAHKIIFLSTKLLVICLQTSDVHQYDGQLKWDHVTESDLYLTHDRGLAVNYTHNNT